LAHSPHVVPDRPSEPPRRPRPKLIARLEARRAQHLRRGLAYRIAFAVAGSLVLLAGVVMLITPGPAFVLIPLGLAMLALEFSWAERALDRTLVQAQAAQERAARASRLERIAGVAGVVALVAAAVGAALHWDLGPF
jgi:uncharacterized protein (TIGR02611 family)